MNHFSQQQARESTQIATALAHHVVSQSRPSQRLGDVLYRLQGMQPGEKADIAFRDLTAAAGGSAGGYLVGTSTGHAVLDALRDGHFLREVGVTVYDNLNENLAVPVVTSGLSGSWLSSEGASIGTGDPTFAQRPMTPKRAAGFVVYSHQLALQVESSEQVLADQLREGVTELLEAAVIAGSGSSGQPLGIVNAFGVGTQSGTSLSYAGVRAMRKGTLLAGAAERKLSWVGAPDVQETIGGRERASGGGRFVWDDDGIMGRPAYATKRAPAGTLVCGDWSRCVIGIWGNSFQIEVDRNYGFTSGTLAARMILSCDVMFHPAAAFSVATSVT